ncbi:MAG: Cardiolipin synthase [Candidatus Woesearchaeota archaeon]|nr:Cardiolipin synthase [Candidatus Woesearchaeota archaeon]
MKKLFLVIILISGCITGNVVKEPKTESIKVYFCPRDNCTQLMVDLLSGSTTIDCAFYDLDSEPIVDLLKKKNARIIIDSENYKQLKSIHGEGQVGVVPYGVPDDEQSEDLSHEWMDLKHDHRSALMHNKFCILDNKTVLTGSTNPTINGLTKNNNNFLIIQSNQIAKNYQEEFDEMWKAVFGKGNKTVNQGDIKTYFCPEDSCSEKLRLEIKKANKSIYFMTFTFTDHRIASELLQKHYSGVLIKGIYEKTRITRYSTYHILKHHNLSIKKDKNSAVMHHKVFIIDNRTLITGSYNPTMSADKRNDENMLIIENSVLINKFLDEFHIMYSKT